MSGQRISGIDDRHRLDESEALLVDTVAALDVPARSRTVPDAAVAPGSTLTWRRLDVLFDAQVASRNLDHAAALAAFRGTRLLHDRVGRP